MPTGRANVISTTMVLQCKWGWIKLYRRHAELVFTGRRTAERLRTPIAAFQTSPVPKIQYAAAAAMTSSHHGLSRRSNRMASAHGPSAAHDARLIAVVPVWPFAKESVRYTTSLQATTFERIMDHHSSSLTLLVHNRPLRPRRLLRQQQMRRPLCFRGKMALSTVTTFETFCPRR